MNQRDINYYHALLRDWGLWLRDGMTTQGMYPSPEWPGKPPEDVKAASGPRRRKPLLPPTQPKETARSATSRPLLYKIEYQLERIHPIVLRQPEAVKLTVGYVYVRGMSLTDTANTLNITPRQVGNHRFRVFNAIKSMV